MVLKTIAWKEKTQYMKKKLLVLSLCTVLFMATGCGKIPKLQNGEEVVASIDGKDVTAEDLYKEMKEMYGTAMTVDLIDTFIANKEITDEEEANSYAEAQIAQIKLQMESSGQDFATALANAGFADEKAYKKYVIASYKKNKVAENFLADQLTDEEINQYYDEEIFGEITAKHILIMPDTTSEMTDEEKEKANENAKQKAADLIKQLDEGADFETLAKENSDDEGTASEGGQLTFTKDKVVDEFWEASSKLSDNEYTKEPVKSSYGYHVILRVSQKEKPELKDVKDDIKDKLVQNKLSNDSNLMNKTWVDVRKKYNLDIIDSTIQKNYENTIKTLK